MKIEIIDEEITERQTYTTYTVEAVHNNKTYHATVTVCDTYSVIGDFEDNTREVIDIEIEDNEDELPENIESIIEDYFYGKVY
jgi:hypothetical protein